MSRSSSRGEIEIISWYSGTVNRGFKKKRRKKKDDESLYFHGDLHTTEADLIRLNGNKITHQNASCVPPPNAAMHFAGVAIQEFQVCYKRRLVSTNQSQPPLLRTNMRHISHRRWIQFSKHKIKHLVNDVYCPVYFPPAIKCQQSLLMC